MADHSISALAREYVRSRVSAKDENGAAYDPTALTVEFAFPLTGVAPDCLRSR